MEENKEFTVTQIANMVGVHRNTIIQHIKKGNLKARIFFDRYLISKDNLIPFLESKGAKIRMD